MSHGTTGNSGVGAAPPSQNLVIAGGYGSAIVAAYIDLMQYLRQMAEQGLEFQRDQAQSLMGTNGQNGMINSWIQTGIQSAQENGAQILDQAYQNLVGAAVGLVAGGAMLGGLVRNCTNWGNAARSEVSNQLDRATSYNMMLKSPDSMKQVVASTDQEMVDLGQGLKERQDQMQNGLDIDQYGKNQANDDLTITAARHMANPERNLAREKADKQIENLQNQKNSFDQRQNTFVQYIGVAREAGSSGGGVYYGTQASGEAVNSGTDRARAEVLQTSVSTTTETEGKASSNAQTNRDLMGQMAQAMASALSAQVQSRA